MRSSSSRSSAAGWAATASSVPGRGSSRSRRRRRSASRSSATSATTRSPPSSRPCRCRRTGRILRRASSSCPTSSCASTTHAASPSWCAETRSGSAARRRDLPRGTTPRGPLEREPSRDEHLRRVERAQEHIREGDVFQVVVAQRATRPTSASAVELYRALRRVNPSPYLFLLELGDLALVGSSPETVVKGSRPSCRAQPDRRHDLRPEKATPRLCSRRRRTVRSTRCSSTSARNDLSRVCLPGSVRVERFMEPERYSHVTHLVSEVVGELRDGVTPFELLRATFPAGTVSGAPKVRAMQIISGARAVPARHLRRCRRLLPAGRPVSSTRASRSARSGCATASRTCRPGGGIVADSDPAAEHEECLAKLRALETAIELAESEQDATS